MDQPSNVVSSILKTISGTLFDDPDERRRIGGINRNDVTALHNGWRNMLQQLAGRLAAEQRLMGDIEAANDWKSLADSSAEDGTAPPHDVSKFASQLGLVPADELLWQSIPQLGPAAFSSRYAIWRFAVRCETALANEMINLSAHARSHDARDRALSLARSAFARAADYRVIRRVAYHTNRSKKHAIALPAQNRIQTASDLGHAAGAIEQWLKLLLKAHSKNVDGLERPMAITNELIEHADTLAHGKIPPRLKNALQRLQQQAVGLEQGAIPAHEAAYLIASEAERIFDYYDALFEAADEPDLFEQAQALSMSALTRLRHLRRACERLPRSSAA